MTLELGCAENYEVYLVGRDLQTNAGLIDNGRLTWSRTIDDLSTAEVFIPDSPSGPFCETALENDLEPWRYGVRIERDSRPVWRGPIVEIERTPGSVDGTSGITLRCWDPMAITRKRILYSTLSYSDVDSGEVFKGVLDAVMSIDNTTGLYCPPFTTSHGITRDFVWLDFQYGFDMLTELAQASVDYTVIDGKLVVYDLYRGWFYGDENDAKFPIVSEFNQYGQIVLATFTQEHFLSLPGYKVSGWEQGNTIRVPGADSGEGGFRRHWDADGVDPRDGVLTHVDVNPLYRPQPGTPISSKRVFQERANTLLALRKRAPTSLAQTPLSPEAPVTIDTMIPGSVWLVDLSETGIDRLVGLRRLGRVDVTWEVTEQGPVETVVPTLIPLGTDEAE